MTIRRPHPIWWAMIRAAAYRLRIYRTGLLLWLLTSMMQLFLLRTIWSAVYGERDSLEGIGSESLLVYLTISALHATVMPNDIAGEMEERISTGRVAADLVRPFGLMKQMVAIQLGSTLGYIPIFLFAIPIAMLIGSLTLPSPANFAAYIVSFVLAYVASMLIWMLVGLAGFWLLNIGALLGLMFVVSNLLSGALVPLWFMPDAIRVVLEWLPFQAVTFLPASIFAGETTGSAIVRPLAVQAVWIGILLVLIRLMWNRAQRKLVIQGG